MTEITDESLAELVYRVRLWYQCGLPDRARLSQLLEASGPESAKTVPENRLQRAVAIVLNELPFLPPLIKEPQSELQDEYGRPYPFATQREYRLALARKSRALIRELAQSLAQPSVPQNS